MNEFELKNVYTAAVQIFLALILSSLIIVLLGASPIDVFKNIFNGSFGKPEKIVKTLLIFLPISLASLALIITFSTGLWNIGIEGQIVLGAIGATVVAKSFLSDNAMSPLFQIILGILTVLNGAQMFLASMHQLSTIILISLSVYLLFINKKVN